jgi:hypothetical protein
VFNLTRIEEIGVSGFLQGGRTWVGGEPNDRVEVGAMLTLRLDAFLGTMVDFSVGYAQPLLGAGGRATSFIELELVF